MGLGDWLFGLFSGMGEEWIVIVIFLIFFIDALVFPTLPELFMVLSFGTNPTVGFGIELLIAAILAELSGIFLLCYIISKIKMPEKISRIASKYINFLVFNDEKIILVNRVAPIIPFLGAFIALIDTWNKKKCAIYIVIGCVIKYGAILCASGIFLNYLGTHASQTVTLVFIIAVMAISFISSYVKKKKNNLE